MTRSEQHAWASLAANGLIFFYFQHRMLDGWAVADLAPKQMIWTYVAIVVAVVVFESVIAGVLAARAARAPERVVEDERDQAIQAAANNREHWFIAAAINILVIQLLADLAYPGHVFPRVDLTRPETIFFILFATLFAGHAVKLASVIVAYRR